MSNETTKPTPAYLVASSFFADDHASLDAYGEAAHPLFEAAGAEVIAMGNVGGFANPDEQTIHTLEGEWPKRASLTVFRFPSMQALEKMWNSDAYQAIKHLRTDVIPPNFTLAVTGFAGWNRAGDT